MIIILLITMVTITDDKESKSRCRDGPSPSCPPPKVSNSLECCSFFSLLISSFTCWIIELLNYLFDIHSELVKAHFSEGGIKEWRNKKYNERCGSNSRNKTFKKSRRKKSHYALRFRDAREGGEKPFSLPKNGNERAKSYSNKQGIKKREKKEPSSFSLSCFRNSVFRKTSKKCLKEELNRIAQIGLHTSEQHHHHHHRLVKGSRRSPKRIWWLLPSVAVDDSSKTSYLKNDCPAIIGGRTSLDSARSTGGGSAKKKKKIGSANTLTMNGRVTNFVNSGGLATLSCGASAMLLAFLASTMQHSYICVPLLHKHSN